VSHADDTSPDPLKLPEKGLKLPEDGLFESTPFADEPAAATPDALLVEPAAAETELEPADGKKKKREKKKKERKEKKPAKKPAKAERPAKPPGPPLWTKIRRASPYTVMLAVAFGALVISVATLVLYLKNYDFKIHP
jgi:hypothetical protein